MCKWWDFQSRQGIKDHCEKAVRWGTKPAHTERSSEVERSFAKSGFTAYWIDTKELERKNTHSPVLCCKSSLSDEDWKETPPSNNSIIMWEDRKDSAYFEVNPLGDCWTIDFKAFAKFLSCLLQALLGD